METLIPDEEASSMPRYAFVEGLVKMPWFINA
jgi:hypothetical protein